GPRDRPAAPPPRPVRAPAVRAAERSLCTSAVRDGRRGLSSGLPHFRRPTPPRTIARKTRSFPRLSNFPVHSFSNRLTLPLRIFALSSSHSGLRCTQSVPGLFLTDG